MATSLLASPLAARFLSCIRYYEPQSEINMRTSLLLVMIYIQIGCSMVGAVAARFNGVLLADLAVSVFAIVGIEVEELWDVTRRMYGKMLVLLMLVDVVWFGIAGLTIRNIAIEKYGLFFVFSLRLALAMQIIGFAMRFLSSLLWRQMYKTYSSEGSSEGDCEWGKFFLLGSVEGVSIYDPKYTHRVREAQEARLRKAQEARLRKARGGGKTLTELATHGKKAPDTNSRPSSATHGRTRSATGASQDRSGKQNKPNKKNSNNTNPGSSGKRQFHHQKVGALRTIAEDDVFHG